MLWSHSSSLTLSCPLVTLTSYCVIVHYNLQCTYVSFNKALLYKFVHCLVQICSGILHFQKKNKKKKKKRKKDKVYLFLLQMCQEYPCSTQIPLRWVVFIHVSLPPSLLRKTKRDKLIRNLLSSLEGLYSSFHVLLLSNLVLLWICTSSTHLL